MNQSTFKVGLIQLAATPSKKENLQNILAAIETNGKSADLLVFPEYCMGYPTEGMTRKYLESVAEPLVDEFISTIAEKTKSQQVSAVIPTFEKEGGNIFNTAVIIDRGSVKGGYRKIHLFDALGYRESDLFTPGSNPITFKIGSMTFGVVICYDIRFPETVKSEVLSGARTVIAPSAWFRGPLKEEQWQTLLMARAHENTSYVLGVGNANTTFVGRSIAVDPLGVKILDLGLGSRIGFCEIDDRRIDEAREKLPVLRQSSGFHGTPCKQLQ